MSVPLLELSRAGCVLGGHRVLNEVSLVLRTGEAVAVVGPNGSGKTILARVALGLAALSVGTGRLVGVDLSGDAAALRLARTHVGAALQGGSLLGGMTVEENLRMAQGWAPASARERSRVRLNRLLLDFQIEGVYGRAASNLSNGERRRVEIARALARDPDLLILDEPFDALDAEAASGLEESLKRALRRRPRALLLLTRDVDLAARFAPTVLRLERGRLQPAQSSERPRPAAAS